MPKILPSLTNVTTTLKSRPFPLITLYGQAGVGKTTLAAEFPKPFLINIEGGVPEGIDIATHLGGPLRTYNDLLAYLQLLANKQHDYKTVIIDSLDTLEKKIIHPHILKTNDFDSIDQTFGRAYTRSAEVFDTILDVIEQIRFKRRMFVVLTAAAVKETFDDLVNNSYHRFNLALQNQISTKVFHQSDFMFFMRPQVYMVTDKRGKNAKPTSNAKRELCTTLMPQYVAKSRAKGLDPIITYEQGTGFSTLRKYFVGFVTGKSQLQTVEAPLQVEEGQTVAEAKQAATNTQASPTAVNTDVVVNPDDDAGNKAAVEQTNLSNELDDDIPF